MNNPFKTYSWFKHYTKGLYFRKTRTQDYRTSSVYSLKAINDKYRFIENCTSILDLGASPGGWSQFVLDVKEKNNSEPYMLFAIDKLQMEKISGVCFINGDYTDCSTQTRLESEVGANTNSDKVSLILADVCPNLNLPESRSTDKTSLEIIAKNLISFSSRFLNKKGILLYRGFHQQREAKTISALFRYFFKIIILEKPESSRTESSELFVICRN